MLVTMFNIFLYLVFHLVQAQAETFRTTSQANRASPILYNSGVTKVEHVTRPIEGSGGFFGRKHSGVVVTTDSSDRWLVHKGPGYGKSSKFHL